MGLRSCIRNSVLSLRNRKETSEIERQCGEREMRAQITQDFVGQVSILNFIISEMGSY